MPVQQTASHPRRKYSPFRGVGMIVVFCSDGFHNKEKLAPVLL